jgi:hypothetical protein
MNESIDDYEEYFSIGEMSDEDGEIYWSKISLK